MAVNGTCLGMALDVNDLEVENLEYFRYCAAHEFHLQQCEECQLLRYPPTTACPWCASPKARWSPVAGKGTVHSYEEVHHAIQPAFRPFTPYLVLLVDLDTQKGQPTPTRRCASLATLRRRMERSPRPNWCAVSASAAGSAWSSPTWHRGSRCRNGRWMRRQRSRTGRGGTRSSDLPLHAHGDTHTAADA